MKKMIKIRNTVFYRKQGAKNYQNISRKDRELLNDFFTCEGWVKQAESELGELVKTKFIPENNIIIVEGIKGRKEFYIDELLATLKGQIH